MSSVYEFLLTMGCVFIVIMLFSLRGMSSVEYFRTDDGKGALKGIVMALGITTLLALGSLLIGCSGKYMNDASVYAGLDSTKKISPQCEDRGPDNRTTSNLGVKANLYESKDERFRSNFKYTHHSCAFSPDDLQYDAGGIEFEYKIWMR